MIDAEGNAAAISLSNGEGNGYIVGRFGFMLNNMLGEEDIATGALGDWRPGTRLSSMMAPTIILQRGRHGRLRSAPAARTASGRRSSRSRSICSIAA